MWSAPSRFAPRPHPARVHRVVGIRRRRKETFLVPPTASDSAFLARVSASLCLVGPERLRGCGGPPSLPGRGVARAGEGPASQSPSLLSLCVSQSPGGAFPPLPETQRWRVTQRGACRAAWRPGLRPQASCFQPTWHCAPRAESFSSAHDDRGGTFQSQRLKALSGLHP